MWRTKIHRPDTRASADVEAIVDGLCRREEELSVDRQPEQGVLQIFKTCKYVSLQEIDPREDTKSIVLDLHTCRSANKRASPRGACPYLIVRYCVFCSETLAGTTHLDKASGKGTRGVNRLPGVEKGTNFLLDTSDMSFHSPHENVVCSTLSRRSMLTLH